MKKSILVFSLLATAFVSCETKEEQKEESTKTVKTVKIDKGSFLDFNDAIIVEVNKLQDILNVLKDKDDQNISEEEMILAAAEAKEKAKEIKSTLQTITPSGKGSEDYLAAAINLAEATANVAQVYDDFAGTLSIIEEEWDEQQVMEWMNMAEPPFMDYQDAFKHVGLMQENYSAFQNIEIESIIEEEVTEEEISEEIITENF